MELSRHQRESVVRTVERLESAWFQMPFGVKRADLEVTLEVLRELVRDEPTWCRYCGETRIVFVPLVKNGVPVLDSDDRQRTMPLEPEPHPAGNVRWDRVGGTCTVLTKVEVADALRVGENLYLSHFANCPRAQEARRGSRGGVGEPAVTGSASLHSGTDT